MTDKRIVISAILLTVLVGSVCSQSVLGLLYPMGIPLRSGSGPSLSLSGTGVGIGNDFYGLTSNPANLGISNRTTFSSAVSGELMSVHDNQSSSRHLDMNLRLFSLTVPLGRFGVLGIAFEPYSNANTRFLLSEKNTFNGMVADTAKLDLGILKKGGAIIWQAGWGYTILKKIRIGIAYKYLNFNQSIAEITQMSGSLNGRIVDSSRTTFSTSGIRGGLQLPVGNLTIGVTGDYFFINKADFSQVIYGNRDTIETTVKSRYYFKPPPSLTAGLSWQINPQWLAAIDAGATLWDRFYSKIESEETLNDAYNVSCGVQFIPAPNLLTPKIYEIIQYRAGLRYTQLPGTKGSEMAATIATGIPMQSNGGLFDIILEYAQRQDGRFADYRENLFSVKLGINGARKWYQSSDESY